jgi:hypothetical protein
MSHATPKLRSFAANLIRHEAVVYPPSPPQRPTVLPVIDRLRPLLATFMGQAGYKALILRALVLAREEAAWLSGVGIAADGGFENCDEFSADHESEEETDGGEILLARLIALLEAFIGEGLTLRLLLQLWPDLPADENFTQENSHD